jgi:hypothetical protein
MGNQPERFNLTVTKYGRRAVIDVKRGDVRVDGKPVVKKDGKRHTIVIDFKENPTRTPKPQSKTK